MTRLKLTELAEVVVEEFYREEIGVGHALLLAKLPLDKQEEALKACFREDWSASSDRKAKRILLPVRNLQTWVEQNILLVLKDAPFDKKDAHLVAIAGSCVDCPKRTGHNKLLFSDFGKQDACKLCGIWANCKSFLLVPSHREDRVSQQAVQLSVLLEPPTGGSFGWRFCRSSYPLGSVSIGCSRPLCPCLDHSSVPSRFGQEHARCLFPRARALLPLPRTTTFFLRGGHAH
jgi:hypothetical protein